MIQQTKDALAAAISTVDGLKGYGSKPTTLKPGDAFVRWRGWSRAEGAAGIAFVATYAVIIVLTQNGGETGADQFAYAKADAIEEALAPLMFIDSIEPTALPAEGADLFTLTVTGRTE